MAGSSGMQFARAAQNRGLIRRRQMLRWGWEHLRYRMRGASDDDTAEVLKVARETLAGVPFREIARMWPEVLAGILPQIYPAMLDEVYAHQDAGRKTFIVSAAGNDMVASLAEVLGMDGGIGTAYEVGPDGGYTGELDGPFVYGPGKVTAIERYATEHDIDLAESYAYSDSVSDLPMLQAVGNAVVVNPDADLAAIARQEGWRIMRFEKIGRRIAIAGTAIGAAAIGGMARWMIRSRRPQRRRPTLRR